MSALIVCAVGFTGLVLLRLGSAVIVGTIALFRPVGIPVCAAGWWTSGFRIIAMNSVSYN